MICCLSVITHKIFGGRGKAGKCKVLSSRFLVQKQKRILFFCWISEILTMMCSGQVFTDHSCLGLNMPHLSMLNYFPIFRKFSADISGVRLFMSFVLSSDFH